MPSPMSMSTMSFGLLAGGPPLPVLATWAVCGLATAGVIARPFAWPEAVWAVAGALVLLAFGLLPPREALAGVASGLDVYLFLAGMMVLAELARREGVFDWLAALATRLARGSGPRLFALVYAVGTLVTVFLSNDATAVVLTPAVAAAARTAGAAEPLPYLLVCAFIANAASFVLPISNPANLVVFGTGLPPLLEWLPRFALPSALSVLATYGVLRWTQRRALWAPLATEVPLPALTRGGRTAALGLALATLVLMLASWRDWPLGLSTALAGGLTALAVLVRTRQAPWRLLAGVSWGVLPLVAGLFVLVRALGGTGLIGHIAGALAAAADARPDAAAWGAGLLAALACNLTNNLPAGLVAGQAVQAAGVPVHVAGAVLVGIDLGPNLSVTGSLATILWLVCLRREGVSIGALAFLRLGALVTPPALVAALAALVLV